MTADNIPAEEWEERKYYYERYINTHDKAKNYLVENIYSFIENMIESDCKRYNEDPYSYYAETVLEFSETAPFLSACTRESSYMRAFAEDSYGKLEILIKNFRDDTPSLCE